MTISRIIGLSEERVIIIYDNGTSMSVPDDAAEWSQYLAWLAEGNTPEPWQPE